MNTDLNLGLALPEAFHDIARDKAGFLSATSGTPAGNTPRPYPYQSQLEAVEKFIAQSQFGVVGEEIRHFTHQIKSDSRRFFPDDSATYKIADDMQHSAIRRVVAMRCLTLVTFVLFSFAAFSRIASSAGADVWWKQYLTWSWWAEHVLRQMALPIEFSAAGDVIVAGITFFAIRYLIRHLTLYWVVQRDVQVARASLKAAHTKLVNECRNVASTISVIEDTEVWPDWAGKSAMVALWYAMRADYVDRYSTTSLWKIRRTFEVREWFFRALKIIIALFALILLGYETGWHPSMTFSFLYALSWYTLAAYSGWDWLDNAPNDFLGILFNEGEKESARTHYFGAFSTHIKNLATMALTMRH